MQPGRLCLWNSTKGPKNQTSSEKFLTHFSQDLAPFSSRVSLTFSLFPGVMWKRKWDNAQSVLVTVLQPFEQHSAVTLTPSVAAFLPNSAGRGPGISPPRRAATNPRPAGHRRPPYFPSVSPPFCYSLFHPSGVKNINYSFPPFLPMKPSNLCLALSQQGIARTCPTPQPSQNAGSGLDCEGSPASIAPADINFVLESQRQLRILWMKDQLS